MSPKNQTETFNFEEEAKSKSLPSDGPVKKRNAMT